MTPIAIMTVTLIGRIGLKAALRLTSCIALAATAF